MMVFMNLFIAVVLEGFYQSNLEYELRVSEEHIKSFKNLYKSYDPNALGFIHVNFLEDLIDGIDKPLGWKKRDREYTQKEKIMRISHLELAVYSIKRVKVPLYWFYDILTALAENALTEDFGLTGYEKILKFCRIF